MTITTVLPLRDARSLRFVFTYHRLMPFPNPNRLFYWFQLVVVNDSIHRWTTVARSELLSTRFPRLWRDTTPTRGTRHLAWFQLRQWLRVDDGLLFFLLFWLQIKKATHWANVVVSCNRENKFKAVSHLVWVCWKAMI